MLLHISCRHGSRERILSDTSNDCSTYLPSHSAAYRDVVPIKVQAESPGAELRTRRIDTMSGQSVVLGKKNGKANGDEDEEMFGIPWFLLNNTSGLHNAKPGVHASDQ